MNTIKPPAIEPPEREKRSQVASFKFLTQIILPLDESWKFTPAQFAEAWSAFSRSYVRGLNCQESAKVIVTIEEQPERRGLVL